MYEIFISTILIFVAVIYDLKYRRIPNSLIILIFFLAVFIQILSRITFRQMSDSLSGAMFPLISLYFLFKIRVLGAGDIKLLFVLGYITGFERILNILIYSMFFAGAYGIILLLVSKDYKERFSSFYDYVTAIFHKRDIVSYSGYRSGRFKQIYFSIAIALAYFLELLLNIFQ